VLAEGVEGSKLCLFSVIMPAKCVSGISPRFHYRRLAFCFLPLATILGLVLCGHFCRRPDDPAPTLNISQHMSHLIDSEAAWCNYLPTEIA
jgi:hypothetical protein